jgi:histidinol dehydrogenase
MMSDARAVSRFELARLGPVERARLLERAEADLALFLEAVRPIIEAVRADGDEALVRFARELDRAEVPAGGLKASAADFERAERRLAPEVGAAIDYAVENIRRFHEAQIPQEMWLKEIRPGAFAGDRYRPIPSVACYVPRGKGAFPSVTMMTTIPALVAGVPKIVVITPPGPDGRVDDATNAAARKAWRRSPSGPRRCRGPRRSSAPAAPTSWPPSACSPIASMSACRRVRARRSCSPTAARTGASRRSTW